MDPILIGLNKLNPFQREVFAECFEKKSGGMSIPTGSGKTLLSICLGLSLTPKDPILVIAGKSIIGNWVSEIDKFFQTALPYQVIDKSSDNWILSDKARIVLITPDLLRSIFNGGHLTISHQGGDFGDAKKYIVPREPVLPKGSVKGVLAIYSIVWGTLLLDEAHLHTNIKTGKCQAIISIYAKNRWLLSGTILDEPKPERILGYFLLLGDSISVGTNLPEATRKIKDVNFGGIRHTLVNRTIDTNFVPPKISKMIVSHTLTDSEKMLYLGIKMILFDIHKKLQELKQEKDTEQTQKFNAYILVIITYLRQSLVCPIIPLSKIKKNSGSELSDIMYTKFNKLNVNDLLMEPSLSRSSRISAALEQVNKHPMERIVIFSCFRTCIKLFGTFIKDRPIFTIESKHTVNKRMEIITEFGKSTNGIFLLTYDIGGTGLNLQMANTVLLLDFWWNAGKSKQAIARILRQGQISTEVYIFYFTSNTGLETALLQKHKSKIDICADLMDGSTNKKIPAMKIDEILKFIALEDNIGLVTSVQS